jgi:hypothetical protein
MRVHIVIDDKLMSDALRVTGVVADNCAPQPNQLETDMSADKDRGIRRQKQKRAKDLKKQRRQPARAGVASGATSRPSEQKIA